MGGPRGSTCQWLPFYKHRRWQRLRKLQLAHEPLCRMCAEDGIATVATVVDHVVPHEGDWNLFVTGKLQSLCDLHHNRAKRYEDLHGHSPQIGYDGWPIDRRHPVFKTTSKQEKQ